MELHLLISNLFYEINKKNIVGGEDLDIAYTKLLNSNFYKIMCQKILPFHLNQDLQYQILGFISLYFTRRQLCMGRLFKSSEMKLWIKKN